MSKKDEQTQKENFVSIIMAAFNAERTISESIQSVLSQTYTDWELLVIDDGSEDATEKIVKGFNDPRIRLIQNEEKQGVSKSRKRGLDLARGEWIAVLDSDDIWVKDKLEKQIEVAKEKDAKLVFTGSGFIDNNGNPIHWYLHAPETLSYHNLLKQNLISNSSVLVKTNLYRIHYAIGDNMHEDFAIYLGITREGIKAFGVDEPLLIYRLTKSSKSSNKLKSAKMNWNTYRYIGLNPLVAFYYMCWYTVMGSMKYWNLKKG